MLSGGLAEKKSHLKLPLRSASVDIKEPRHRQLQRSSRCVGGEGTEDSKDTDRPASPFTGEQATRKGRLPGSPRPGPHLLHLVPGDTRLPNGTQPRCSPSGKGMSKRYVHMTECSIVTKMNVLSCKQRYESKKHNANEKDESQRAAHSEACLSSKLSRARLD